MKIKILFLSILSVIFFSCESTPKDPHAGHDHDKTETHEDHSGHDHGDHEGHDHENEEAHNHDDHKDHNHEGEEAHNHDDHDGHDHAAETAKSEAAKPKTEGTPNEIVLEPAQAKELGLEYTKVEPKEFTASIRTSGMIEATPGDDAAIIATTSGIVSFGGRKIVEGITVNRGAALLCINSSSLTDDNLSSRIADAQAAYRKAQADLNRIQELYKDQMATAQSMEDARFAEATSRKALETLTRNTSGGVKSITSPLSGYITSLVVKDGDYVTQGQTIGTVSSTKTVVLKADLPARHFDKLSTISSANFSTPYNGQVYDISAMNGKKLATARSASNYTVPIRFEIDNRDGLIAGSVVDVYLKTTTRKDVIAIPTSSLTEEQGAYYVYIRIDAECYEKRNVRIGQRNGLDTEILGGLKIGETVVSKGAYFVRLASMSGAIPDGHHH